jgi:hypothetical protein
MGEEVTEDVITFVDKIQTLSDIRSTLVQKTNDFDQSFSLNLSKIGIEL